MRTPLVPTRGTTTSGRGAPWLPSRWPSSPYALALVLAAGLFGLLLLNNSRYLFHTELYENHDWASDSLFVQDAERGVLLHGHYSRWHFFHPGPALLDLYALGETVCFRWLHLVPTPYNGQVIAICALETLCFSLALAIFADRMGKDRGGALFFLPLALLFAVWHYGTSRIADTVTTQAAGPFLQTWPPSVLLLVFLCFLVAVASAASGGGRELPLVAFTGGCLVHFYVAQPLFVVPLALLAYAGLLASCHPASAPVSASRGRTLTAGWHAFPRAHILAGAILALFILPLLIDALQGRVSNLHLILDHMRRQHEPPKPFLRSLCYFLVFGGYSVYDPLAPVVQPGPSFGRYSASGMGAFIELHWRPFLCWSIALLAPPALFAAARQPAAVGDPVSGAPKRPENFIAWFYVVLGSAFTLTLVWGMKQDGPMTYFNGYFNHSIYYGAALGLAAALAAFLQALARRRGWSRRRLVIGLALWLGVAAAMARDADLFQDHVFDSAEDRAAAHAVMRAAATLPPGGTCVLDCDPWKAWLAMIAATLQLDRMGYQVRVNGNLTVLFGIKRTFIHEPVDFSRPVVRWLIEPVSRDPAQLSRWPLLRGCGIKVLPTLDLNPDGGIIRFSKEGNYLGYACLGWAPPDGNYAWADQSVGLMQFRPLPLPEHATGVDLLIRAASFGAPADLSLQRMELVFSGVNLGEYRLPLVSGAPLVQVHIGADAWRAAVSRGNALLFFRFPDAKSPESLGTGADIRQLGGGFESIEFRPSF